MIVIVGKICSGKTTILNLLKKKGYKTLEVDKFVVNLYNDKYFGLEVQNKIDYPILTNQLLDKQKLKTWLNLDFNNFKIIEKFVNYELLIHLQNHYYDFVEFPILFKAPNELIKLFTKIWHLQIPEKTRKSFLLKKYGKNPFISKLDTLNNYNWAKNEFFAQIEVVNISWEKINSFPRKELLI